MTYNGWPNWQSWNVALWSSAIEPTYRAIYAAKPYTPAEAEQKAREIYPNGTPDMDSAAELRGVAWDEIAEAWNET
jgi:hypothetical protein